jgi:hypothetical protein
MPLTDPSGPAIRAFDPWMQGTPQAGKMHQLLSNDERARLAVIATVVRFKKGDEIYRVGDRAEAVFNIISGVVKGTSKAPMAPNISWHSSFPRICSDWRKRVGTRIQSKP